MSGPIKKAKTSGERAGAWERWGLGAGLIVVVGLLIESGPELVHSIIFHVWPSRGTIGNLIVVLGVAGEVIFSWRAVRAAREAELEAERTVAELQARTAEANRATAEANERTEAVRLHLAETEALVVKLRLAQEPRARNFNFRKFASFLEGKPKGIVKIFCRVEDEEAAEFGELIRNTLLASRWTADGPTLLQPGSVPTLQAFGARPEGITIMQRSVNALTPDDPYKILCDAFIFMDVLSLAGRANPRIAEGEVWIVIGAKP